MTRYRIGAVNGPILGGLVHRLAAEQPQAQITHLRLAGTVDELAQMVARGRLDYALVGVCGDAVPSAGPRPGLAGRRRSTRCS